MYETIGALSGEAAWQAESDWSRRWMQERFDQSRLATEREDRWRKKFDYFATPSIQQYAIIEQDARHVDLYTRSGDRSTDEIIEGDAILNLSSIGVEISLDTVYEDTELDATRLREDGRQAPAL